MFHVTGKIGNHGDGTGPRVFGVRVYLSQARRPDVPVKEFQSFFVAPGTSSSFDVEAKIPADLPPGFYTVKVALDPQNGALEYDENNNVALSAGSIRVIGL